jgi:hypothetical protein
MFGSPVTAGGIHTALKHGFAAGNSVADFLDGRAADPSGWFVRSYPQFRMKRVLRFLFDHLQGDVAFNWLLATSPLRHAASSSTSIIRACSVGLAGTNRVLLGQGQR